MSVELEIDTFLDGMVHRYMSVKSRIREISDEEVVPFVYLCDYFIDKPHILSYREWKSLLVTFAYILHKKMKNRDASNHQLRKCHLKACNKVLDVLVIAAHEPDMDCCRELIWAAATLLLEWHCHFLSDIVTEEENEIYRYCVKTLSKTPIIPETNENILHTICSWTHLSIAGQYSFVSCPDPSVLEIMIVIGGANIRALDNRGNTPLECLKMNLEDRVNEVVSIDDEEKGKVLDCIRILHQYHGHTSAAAEELVDHIRNTL